MTQRPSSHVFLPCLILLLALTACGGDDGKGSDQISLPGSNDIAAKPCAGCEPGHLRGVAAGALALAHAEVQVFDAQGRTVSGQADAQGQWELPVHTLSGELLVQVRGELGGQPVLWHSAVRSNEVGRRALIVSPLSELLVAYALGDLPGDLLQQGRVEFARLAGQALDNSERRVAALVAEGLSAAGLEAQTDLRTGLFAAPSQAQAPEQLSPLARALALLVLEPASGGYRLRHLVQDEAASLLLQPAEPDVGQRLATLSPAELTRTLAGLRALPQAQEQLQALARLYAQGLPEAAQLKPLLSPALLHSGLDAQGLIQQVLLRREGLRTGAAQLKQIDAQGRLRLAFALQAPAPHSPLREQSWFVEGRPGQWLWAGDGSLASPEVRNAAALEATPRPASDVRALGGVRCGLLPASANLEACQIEGGAGDVVGGGFLDLGHPTQADFGLMGWYRSDAATPLQRLREHGRHSRLLAEPSSRVKQYLSLQLEAHRVAPSVARVQVQGPGLPAAGLLLYPPAAGAHLGLQHWTLDPHGVDDWHALPLGWCPPPQTAQACASGWEQVGAGSLYRFTLLNAQGQSLQVLERPLPTRPLPADTLYEQRQAWFARWDLAGLPAQQPRAEQLLGGHAAAGDALLLSLPWRAPERPGQTLQGLHLEWQRATLSDTPDAQILRLQERPEGKQGQWRPSLAARPGFHSRWLSLRLEAQDRHGNRYWHVISPSNPY